MIINHRSKSSVHLKLRGQVKVLCAKHYKVKKTESKMCLVTSDCFQKPVTFRA